MSWYTQAMGKVHDEVQEYLADQPMEAVNDIANQIKTAKQRDDKRGVRIIRDYSESHSAAEENKVVKSAFVDYETYKTNINKMNF